MEIPDPDRPTPPRDRVPGGQPDPGRAPGDHDPRRRLQLEAYELGGAPLGGTAQGARVPAGWIVPLPDGLTTRTSMVVGTAGYTAALSVLALLDHGITPDAGTVLVTGATGGVGSMAVAMLAALGFTVAAGTGKAEAGECLRRLGPREILDRDERTHASRPRH